MIWRTGPTTIQFPRPALVMGILNVTPDSFFDGGRNLDTRQAIECGHRLAAEGADIIDVGGESTRPGAAPVPVEEELRRVIPVVRELARHSGKLISIDTRKPEVAAAALDMGAQIVNDVAANRTDEVMGRLVGSRKAGYVVMHMQGAPATMQEAPSYADVVGEVHRFFEDRIERLGSQGVEPEQIVLDVGIGFGKSLEHNLKLLANLARFNTFGRPTLLGASRKSFLGALLGLRVGERLAGSLACACQAVHAGVHVVRVHDVAESIQAIRVTEAILNRRT